MGMDEGEKSTDEAHSKMAEFWTKLAVEGISVDDVPQVGHENLQFRFAKGKRGALPGMVKFVNALDREGTKFHIALFDTDMPLITATLSNKSKRLRRLSQLMPAVSVPAVTQPRARPDGASGT